MQPPRWEAGAAGAGTGAWGAGVRLGLLGLGRGEWERARQEHAGALLRLALGRRAAREQPAARPRAPRAPPSPRAARGRQSGAAPWRRGQAAGPPGRVAAEAAAGRLLGRPERALPPAATRSRRWLGRRAPRAAEARPRPRRERAPVRSRREAARAAACTDGVAGRSWAAAQRRRRRGRRQGTPPARMLRFLRRTFGRRSMQRYARGAAGRGTAGLGDERDGGPRGGPAAAAVSTLPAAPGGSVFPAGGGPLLMGCAAVHISAAGASKTTLYCRVFLLDGTEVSVDLPVSDGAGPGHWHPAALGAAPFPRCFPLGRSPCTSPGSPPPSASTPSLVPSRATPSCSLPGPHPWPASPSPKSPPPGAGDWCSPSIPQVPASAFSVVDYWLENLKAMRGCHGVARLPRQTRHQALVGRQGGESPSPAGRQVPQVWERVGGPLLSSVPILVYHSAPPPNPVPS